MASNKMDIESSFVAEVSNLASLESTDVNLYVQLLETVKTQDEEDLKVAFRDLEKISRRVAELLAMDSPDKLPEFVQNLRDYFDNFSNAKASKLITSVLRDLSNPKSSWGLQVAVDVCERTIENCKNQNKTFLRHRVEQNLCELYYHQREYKKALGRMGTLLYEVKRLDDKFMLVELHLLESKIQHSLRNITKSKAALTACRASASSVYVNPDLQAELDLQGGSIATEEGDYKTAASYFYEAFEGCRAQKDEVRAKRALVYMLMNKILARKFKELKSIISSQIVLDYTGVDFPEIQAMHEIAKCTEARDVKALEAAIAVYPTGNDTLLKAKLQELSSDLQEENLLKLLQPYSKVQISHIAKLIDLDVGFVTRKLSHMILDQKLNGILDQGAGAVIMYDQVAEDKTYEYALQTLEELEDVVDHLLNRARTNL